MPSERVITVATDATGKSIRNLLDTAVIVGGPTLNGTIALAATVTSLTVTALPFPLFANDIICVGQGLTSSETYTVSANAAAAATSVSVTSQTATQAHAVGDALGLPVARQVVSLPDVGAFLPGVGVTFDGSSGYVSLGARSGPDAHHSVDMWIKGSGGGGLFFNGGASIELYVGSDGKLYFGFWNGGSVTILNSTTLVNDNVWHHVAVTYSAGTSRLYLDGVQVATSATAIAAYTNQNFFIGNGVTGAGWTNGVQWYGGTIASVAYYLTTLPATRIAAHYNSGNSYAQEVLADNPLSWWRLDEPAGSTTARDSAGTIQGTYTGTVSNWNVPGPSRVYQSLLPLSTLPITQGGIPPRQEALAVLGANYIWDAVNAVWIPGRQAIGTAGIPSVNTEGTKATYRLAGLVTPAAAPTDVIRIQGSSTKTVRITRIAISVESTASGIADLLLIRRSTAGSGGTSTSPTIGQHDTTDAAATAAVFVYTANPTVGTLVANLGAKKVAGTTNPLAEWVYSAQNDKAIVLRGTSEFLCINGNGATLLTGEVWGYDIEFTEE